MDLPNLLDAGESGIVTLVAGNTSLAAHKAVLAARSPVFATIFGHDMVEARGGRVTITDVEGPVLRHLLAYLYTLQAPQLPSVAPQLLVAADRYGVLGLKADCERQLAAQLSVETAASTAVLALRHSDRLKHTAVNFITAHYFHVMRSQSWADTMRSHPQDLLEVIHLLPDPSSVPKSLSAVEMGRRLIQAARDGAVGKLRSLFAAGAELGARDGDRDTALHWAAWRGHAEATRWLLGNGAVVDARNSWQNTPLHDAAYSGHAAVVRLLLQAGAEVDARNSKQSTPLHMAAYSGHTAVVRLLLQAGAEVYARNSKQSTPLHMAAYSGHTAVVRLLLASSAYHSSRQEDGWTPLHYAALKGHAEAAAELLEAGASRVARTDQEETPLDIARRKNHHQLVVMLSSN